jgi:TonB family protein
MKTTYNIFIFALALVLMQACGSKSKENVSETTDSTSNVASQEKVAQQKQEALKKREAAQRERLRIAAEKRAAAEKYYKDASGALVYNKAEVAPAFPGGKKAMMKYFDNNLKYPQEAVSKGWEGTIYVEFIVGKDGYVRDARVTDETDSEADQSLRDEAIRVVSNMPKWAPGTQVGAPVSVKYDLPVAFRLI